MNTKVHYVIVKAAAQLLGDMSLKLLGEKIRQTKWNQIKSELGINGVDDVGGLKQETYFDLVMLGAYLEDKPKIPSEISEPTIRDPLVKAAFEKAAPGKYQHWMEHFWNDRMDESRGLVLDIDYICDVIAECLGDHLWGELLSEINSEIIELVAAPITALCKAGTLTLDEFRSAPVRAREYWKLLIKQYKEGEKERAYLNLGRVCHLLADVGTPCHMHGDPHAGFYPVAMILEKIGLGGLIDTKDGTGIDDDQYEYYTGLVIEDNLKVLAKENDTAYEKALPVRWNVASTDLATYKREWEMIDYFKNLGKKSRCYDSDDVDGKSKGHPYHWEHFNPLDPYTYKLEREWNGDLRNSACVEIASDLIPETISHTAGLIMHFFDKVDEKIETTEPGAADLEVKVKQMHVLDDTDPCGAGEIYMENSINGRKAPPTGRIKADTGETVSLAAKGICWNSFLRAGENINLNYWSHASDNDDVDLWLTKIRDSESLGTINYTINTKDIPSDTHYTVTCSSKKPHYYDVDIDFYKKVQKVKKVIYVNDAWRKKYKDRKEFVSKRSHSFGRYKPPVTLYLNFEDSTLHLQNKQRKCCGHFARKRNISINNKVEITLNADEIFETNIDKLFANDSGKSFTQMALNSIAKLKKLAKTKKRPKLAGVVSKIENSDNYRIFFKENGSLLSRIIKVKYPEQAEKFGDLTKANFAKRISTKCQCCKDEKEFWK